MMFLHGLQEGHGNMRLDGEKNFKVEYRESGNGDYWYYLDDFKTLAEANSAINLLSKKRAISHFQITETTVKIYTIIKQPGPDEIVLAREKEAQDRWREISKLTDEELAKKDTFF